MNLWDSVHRGLEKASQEAARIAKIQRLRSTIDTLSRQIQAQQSTLVNKAMELFATTQLTQPDLLLLCQHLTMLQQQLAQAQQELRVTQSQGPAVPPQASGYPPSAPADTLAQTIYAPPPYQPYIEQTAEAPIPPPPPGVDLTISQQHTMLVSEESGQHPDMLTCSVCRTVVLAGNAYCHNCGTPVKAETSYLPTTRGSSPDQPLVEDLRTMRAEEVQGDSTPHSQTDGGL